MSSTLFRKAGLQFLALCFVFSLAAAAHAQDYKPLLGDWAMTSETDGDPIQWTLSLKEVEGKLTALCQVTGSAKPAKDVTFANGVLKFSAPYEDVYYNVTLKAAGDHKIEGTWEGDGNSGRTSGVKN